MNTQLIEPMMSDLYFLEPLNKLHAPKMYAGLCVDDDYKFIPSNPPASVEELAARYERISQRHTSGQNEIWLNWVIISRQSADYMGYVQATIMLDKECAYIAYHVFGKYQKQKVAKQCVRLLINYLFNNYKLSHVDALIDTRNLASIGLAESLELKKINEIKDADYFKESTSNEFHYRVLVSDWAMKV
ncbi:GNAT family N-acetyltransferase [Enterobacter sp. Bisph1]|uniref:GNAT family N-acetyltransferase n=1 Tax=Enterobacter sp. Bisph1 TaxID=1274399 RepID=UPI00057C0023|nr:GNAT family N-acetyltransferase [Enterobacter sp. Bisph1]